MRYSGKITPPRSSRMIYFLVLIVFFCFCAFNESRYYLQNNKKRSRSKKESGILIVTIAINKLIDNK